MCYNSFSVASSTRSTINVDPVVTNIYKDSFNNLIVDTSDNGSYTVCLGDSIEDLKNKLKEYENKLQREKVHIGRRTDLKGYRVYGRRRKIAISKGSFRNKKGVRSVPSCVS
jgi:hypothetical protein